MAFIEGVPTVVVKLDKPRTLAFTNGAILRILSRLHTLALPPEDDIEGRLRMLPTYVWACLGADGSAELSVEQIEDMIHPGNQQAIQAAMDRLVGASSPEADADAPAVPTQAGPQLASAG